MDDMTLDLLQRERDSLNAKITEARRKGSLEKLQVVIQDDLARLERTRKRFYRISGTMLVLLVILTVLQFGAIGYNWVQMTAP